MKLVVKASFVLTAFFILAGLAVAQETKKETSKNKSKSQVSVKYDKKKDLTTVRSKEITITRLTQEKDVAYNIPLHQMDLEISFTYQGQQSSKPVEEVVLRFRSVAGNNIFLRQQQIIAALDREDQEKGRAMALGTSDYKSSPPKFNSVYEEIMVVKIPAEALKKMAAANTLELYVGPVGYRLTGEQHDLIREMASFLPRPSSDA